MWGYSYTTTGNKTVYVYFGEHTGDTYTYTFDNYVNWYNATSTYGNYL